MITRYKKAISPLIATIILIAVTLAIAVIAISWFYGALGTASGPIENLQIFQDARLVVSSSGTKFSVTLKNSGTTVVAISKVYIKENASCSSNNPTLEKGTAQVTELKPGELVTLSVTFSNCQVMPETKYTVLIVTGSGQAYPVLVTAERG
ncbi:MAG: archaellin/type IV pilin N-terminal domain-containing protein [Sulfolobales archaeon]